MSTKSLTEELLAIDLDVGESVFFRDVGHERLPMLQ